MTKSQYRAALALIEDPQRWTQGTFARAQDGTPVRTRFELAVQWCAEGACLLATKYDYAAHADELAIAAHELFHRGPVSVNDQLGHAAVLSMFRRAMALAPEE